MFNITLDAFLTSDNVKAVLEFQDALLFHLNAEVIIAGGFCRDLTSGILPSDIDMYIFNVEPEAATKGKMQGFIDWLSKLENVPSHVVFRDLSDLTGEEEETYDLVFPERILGILEFDLKLPTEFTRPGCNSDRMTVQIMLVKGGFDMTFFNDFTFGASCAFIENHKLYLPNVFINDMASKKFKARNAATKPTSEYYTKKMLEKYPDFTVEIIEQ